jgi:hypothetical protein
MATETANVASLYHDVVADLIPYYDNFVLLPNNMLITNSYNLTGGIGNTMKIPVTNAWTTGNSSVGENTAIIGNADQDFVPTSVSLSVNKRGAATLISEESLEDGGFETVRNAVVTRLSRSIAQATDTKGFNVMASGAETDLTDISGINVSNDGHTNAVLDGSTNELGFVFSPEAMAYAVKREPTVKMFEDIDKDQHQMVATVRNGFAQVRGGTDSFIRALASGDLTANAATSLTLDFVSKSVANLRNVNAPTDGSGFYMAVITPGQELQLAKAMNGIGSESGSIGSVAQDLANQALLDGLITQALGCRFIRSNNTPSGLAAA